MFYVANCIGGIKIIKEDNIPLAWIDIFGDLLFSDSIEVSKKISIISFLEENHIEYNKSL